jgi:leader peptidase (prepilin peptidase)/N-methyltransferase
VASAAIGAFAIALLPYRLGDATIVVQVVFAAWFACLVTGFAIDLDQRLLPDELTIPIIPIALILDATGNNPLVREPLLLTLLVALVVPAALYLLSIPFGAGAFGMGDVKLLIGVGLMLGLTRTIGGLLAGLLAAGIVLVVLLALGRIGRRTYVPFGPFLVFGALWGIFVTP